MSKMDAVRLAVAALGVETRAAEMQKYIKREFGFQMSTDHISTCRAKVRREIEAGTGVPMASSATPAPAATPAQAKTGSSRGRAKKSSKRKSSSAGQSKPAPAAKPAASSNGRSDIVSVDDVKLLRGLMDRVPSSHLKTLIDVLGG
jgi:hypothetical protein